METNKNDTENHNNKIINEQTENILKKTIPNFNRYYNSIEIVKILNSVTLFDRYYICIILITVVFVYILYIVQ